MSIESAKAYMQRMREDPEFRKRINDCEDRQANWELLKAEGYEFTVDEFKLAQKDVFEQHGTDQLPKKD